MKWTREEDTKLASLATTPDWAKVAKKLGRTSDACRNRWSRIAAASHDYEEARMGRRIDTRLTDLERRVAALENIPTPAVTAPPVPQAREVKGVFVSHYQRHVDWPKVDPEVRYAYSKVSEGADFVDPRWKENVEGARAAGLRVMSLHYGTPHWIASGNDATVDAEIEARWHLECLRDAVLDVVTFGSGRRCTTILDIEEDVPGLAPTQVTSWIVTWCKEVEAGGLLVGLYTSDQWLRGWASFDIRQIAYRPDGTMRPFIVPRYGKNDGQIPDRDKYNPREKTPDLWGEPDAWQYTSAGQIQQVGGGYRRVCYEIANILEEP